MVVPVAMAGTDAAVADVAVVVVADVASGS